MKKLTIPNGHKLPNHLFVGCDGDLHDTRKDNWSVNTKTVNFGSGEDIYNERHTRN